LPFPDTTIVPAASDLVVIARAALAAKEFLPAQEIEDVVIRDSDIVGGDIEVQSAAEEEGGLTPGSWPSIVTSPSFSTPED
jgi:hypothetical protein